VGAWVGGVVHKISDTNDSRSSANDVIAEMLLGKDLMLLDGMVCEVSLEGDIVIYCNVLYLGRER